MKFKKVHVLVLFCYLFFVSSAPCACAMELPIVINNLVSHMKKGLGFYSDSERENLNKDIVNGVLLMAYGQVHNKTALIVMGAAFLLIGNECAKEKENYWIQNEKINKWLRTSIGFPVAPWQPNVIKFIQNIKPVSELEIEASIYISRD